MKKILIATGIVIVVVIIGSMVAFRTPASAPTDESTTTEPVALTGNPDIGNINPNVGTTTTGTTGTTSGAKTFTMADVAAHNSQSSCYTTINGSVYDVTSWINQHPGGAEAILSLCGKDGTAAFTQQHGGQRRPEAELATFKIGVLAK